MAVSVSAAVAALILVVVAGSSNSRAVLSIAFAVTALGAAWSVLSIWVLRAAPSAESRSLIRSGPIFAVDLQRELRRVGPRDRVGIVGTPDLVASVIEVMPPVDQLRVLTSLPRSELPDEPLSKDVWEVRRVMTLLSHENALVHVEREPVGGAVVQFGEQEMLVSLPEFSRSKRGLPAVWLALRAEDNRALIEDFTVDLSRRWEEAEAFEPHELEDRGWGSAKW